MQLPLEINFEPPTRGELRAAAKPICFVACVLMILGIPAVVASTRLGSAAYSDEAPLGTLRVVSVPPGASIEVDGHEVGRTPALITVAPGSHRIRLQATGYAATAYQLEIQAGEAAALDAELWLQAPRVEQLRSPLPGATIANAVFSSNGDVALLLALPSSTERQLWVLAPNRQPRRVGPARADGPLAISSDGERVAYLAPGQGSRAMGGRLEELWITGPAGGQGDRAWVLPVSARDQALVDLTWAPDGQHLLVISRQQGSVGGTRIRLLWLAVGQSEPKEILTLPGEIVPGSYEWSPDGHRLAYLVRTPQGTSLCLLDTADGQFRYLGDVRRDDSAPLPFPPVAWAPDGRNVAYAGLAATKTSGWWFFGEGPRSALFLTDVFSPRAHPLGAGEGQSPAWRTDGGVVALARAKANSSLVVRLIDQHGGAADLANLPIDLRRVGKSLRRRGNRFSGPGSAAPPEPYFPHQRPQLPAQGQTKPSDETTRGVLTSPA